MAASNEINPGDVSAKSFRFGDEGGGGGGMRSPESPRSRVIAVIGRVWTHTALAVSVLAFASAFVTAALAQTPAGFRLEQVMSSPFPTNLTSASKTNRIAWVFNAKGERNVWIADAPQYDDITFIVLKVDEDQQV